MALHSLYCADVPLRNCSLTPRSWYCRLALNGLLCADAMCGMSRLVCHLLQSYFAVVLHDEFFIIPELLRLAPLLTKSSSDISVLYH